MTNIEPSYGPCEPWTTLASVRTCDCSSELVSDELVEAAIPVASELLFILSGRQFTGACTRTVRPVSCSCVAYANRHYGCRSSVVHLGYEPLLTIEEVRIDGAVVNGDQYRIDDWRWLVLETEDESWPCCTHMVRVLGGLDTWSVRFTYGTPIPQLGVAAANRLTCELAKACSSEAAGECKLPKRVTNIVRQGVTQVLLDPFTFLEEGRLGVYDVDVFLGAFNPARLTEDATVVTPDVTQRSVLTTWRQ